MASIVKTTRNGTNWASNHPPSRTDSGYMSKIPFFNNPNPNPSSNFSSNSRKQLPHQNGDDFSNPTVSDDAASFSHCRPSDSTDVGGNFSHYETFDISSYSPMELRSLKIRLSAELDRVRSLSIRIETGDLRNGPVNSKKRSMPGLLMNPKEAKRMATSNGNMNRKPQSPPYLASSQLMKMCAQVLSKLMKQKFGNVFNSPVDVVGMGLHDYNQIIKHPMDLGTIKTNLSKNLYPTPEEFAADVRLTFENALRYNPKGHEVHTLAEQFSAKFEQAFRPVQSKFEAEKQLHQQQQQLRQAKPVNRVKDDPMMVVERVQENGWRKNPSPEASTAINAPKIPDHVELPRSEPPPRLNSPPRLTLPCAQIPTAVPVPAPPPPAPAQVVSPAPEMVPVPQVKGHVGRGSSGKLPKPKAKDPNKRDMTPEEKHKLGLGLQDLPMERMGQVIQIVRKRNGDVTQDGDEIELDIEAVDTETLWELDRFVTNYKKWASKIKRQALMENNNDNVGQFDAVNQAGVSETTMEMGKAKKGGGDGEEDVDIGDEMPVNNFPPLEIEKDDDKQQGDASNSSGSSSSSGSDSSSSDSDSGSSSGSDSDVDDAQSRDNESKTIHQ